jgi:phosphoglycolate phosphatase-like HAD superfamily hydrolase
MIDLSIYKNIILDFDGVILDANSQRKLNMKFVLDENLNQELSTLTYDYFSKNSGVSRNVKLGKFIEDKFVLNKVLKDYYELNLSTLPKCDLVKGVKEFIVKFHNSKKIFILTGADEEEVKILVKNKNLNEYIFHLGGGPKSKIQHLKELQLKDETIFFGDSKYDNFTASEYEFDFVFVNGYTNTKEKNLQYSLIGKVKDFSILI